MLNYHIGGIFEIFILSTLGYFIPFYLIKCNGITIDNMIDQLSYRCIKSFSAGIILGVAFLHLLAEASEALSEYAEYPVALAMVLLGFMATLAMEQLAMHTMLSISNDNKQIPYVSSMTQDHNHNSHNHSNDKSNLESLELPELQVQSSELGHHSHEHVHSKQMVPDKDLNKSFVKAIVLEAAIACHSIIVGFGVGATKDVPTLKVLLVAIGLHQFFEGVGLGSALLEGKLSMTYVYSFGILFALTAPIGVVLGAYSSEDDETGALVAGFADSFAAGILIYSSIVDMIAEDYMDNNFKTRHFGKMCMYFSLAFGISVMAILAIWA
jgi:zinc transporter 1/2/3